MRHDYAAADGQDSADLEIRIAVHAEVLGAPGAWRGVRGEQCQFRLGVEDAYEPDGKQAGTSGGDE